MKNFLGLIFALFLFLSLFSVTAEADCHCSGNSDNGKGGQELAIGREDNIKFHSNLDSWSGAWLPLNSLKDEFAFNFDADSRKNFRAISEDSFSEVDSAFVSFKIAGNKILFFDDKFDHEPHLITKRIFSFNRCMEVDGKDYFVFNLEKEINVSGRKFHNSKSSSNSGNAVKGVTGDDISTNYIVLSPIVTEEFVRSFYISFAEEAVDEEVLQDLIKNRKMEFVISFDAYKRFELTELFAVIDRIMAK